MRPDLVGRRVMVNAWLRDPDGVLERARYLGSEVDGGFAEYVVVPAGNVHPVDSELSDVELAHTVADPIPGPRQSPVIVR